MISKEIDKLLEEENGQEKIYKLNKKYFDLVDKWEQTFTNSGLLTEYELSLGMDQLTGCLMKFGPIAGALESQKE